MAENVPVPEELKKIIGLKLSIIRRYADMRGFHFGEIRDTISKKGRVGTSGEYIFHVQCPWRIEHGSEILTGSADLWDPAEESEDIDWDTWHYSKNPNYQDKMLGEWFQGYDEETQSHMNADSNLVVEGISMNNIGDLSISLSGGYVLAFFPNGAIGEHWRFFPHDVSPHFVVEGLDR